MDASWRQIDGGGGDATNQQVFVGDGAGGVILADAERRRVHAEAMLLEIVLPGKTLAANVAQMRFWTGMRRQMPFHLRSLRKGATTDGASVYVRPLNIGHESLRFRQRQIIFRRSLLRGSR